MAGKPVISSEEIYKYTLRADAVAKCLVRDCATMTVAYPDWNIWWLGTVPVRALELVGIVVGVAEWEKRTLYTIDDGTGVIDTIYLRTPVPVASKPSKPKSRKPPPSSLPQEYVPAPFMEVGNIVRVVGKLEVYKETHQILLERIEKCSPNAEPIHWLEVLHLHQTKYASAFTLPAPLAPNTPTTQRTSQRNPVASPSFATPYSSPSKSSVAPSSPIGAPNEAKVVQLRHPSRLRSRDLTQNAFRIYLKHYMEAVANTPVPQQKSSRPQSCRPWRTATAQHDPSTPRNRRAPLAQLEPDQTPRASAVLLPSDSQEDYNDDPLAVGMSSSYLRRAPELMDLARRVVKVEAKRREKTARLREESQTSASGSRARADQSRSVIAPTPAMHGVKGVRPASSRTVTAISEPIDAKVKRLFRWAIGELFKEGAIILGDGPGRWWDTTDEGDPFQGRVSCWRNTSTSTTADDSAVTNESSVFSTSHSSTVLSRSISSARPEDEPPSSSLQQQNPEEESYVPVSSALLRPFVIKAMEGLLGRTRGTRGFYPTDILERMKNTDGRWDRIGVWSVEEVLKSVEGLDGGAWKVGGGKWGLM